VVSYVKTLLLLNSIDNMCLAGLKRRRRRSDITGNFFKLLILRYAYQTV